MMELSAPLDMKKLKIGLYRAGGAPIYETIYPDDDEIKNIDDTHLILKLHHEKTMLFVSQMTLRATIYTQDLQFVNSGETQINMVFEKEPVNKNLK